MSRPAVIALLLALAVAAVYAPVIDFEFVDYDDDVYVTKNQEVRQGLTAEGFRWAFTTGRASNWHPVTWLSHMLWFVFTRAFMGSDFGAVRNARDW